MAPPTDNLEPPQLRDLADRARRLARGLSRDDDRARLLAYAVELDGEATDRERLPSP